VDGPYRTDLLIRRGWLERIEDAARESNSNYRTPENNIIYGDNQSKCEQTEAEGICEKECLWYMKKKIERI